jgi:Fic family protein
MDYTSLSFSAETQAEFFQAESELIRLSERLSSSPSAKYMKATLLAIDAIFAIRISRGIVLPIVPLLAAYDKAEWKQRGSNELCLREQWHDIKPPKNHFDAAMEALQYMQAMGWVASNTHPGMVITIDSVLHLHEILLSGDMRDDRYHAFRKTYLPYKKGINPSLIYSEMNDLCSFANKDYFSPVGQATVIHHAFESIVPFDTMIDRTGLAFAFMTLFRRGLLTNGYMVPICWGASLEKEYRRQLRDASRYEPSTEAHIYYRERWAAYNARNTYMSVIIAKSFLAAADSLKQEWESRNLRVPLNSALDKLICLCLVDPRLSIARAASIIGKSYGATNEAMSHLVKKGIVKEVALDGRERMFVCEQASSMITAFVDSLAKIGDRAEPNTALER